jgi:hypothetical protein
MALPDDTVVMDRRAFLRVSAGGAAIAIMPSIVGCSTSGSLPPLETAKGPTAITASGTRFEARPDAHAIVIATDSGERKTGGVGMSLGKFNYPVGVVVIGELAYVVEKGNHRVQIIGADGVSGGEIGAGELNYPGGIAVTAKNELLVADSRNGRIVGYTADGVQTRELGAGVLSAPAGLTVVGDSIIVADPGLGQIVEIDRRGVARRALGTGWVLPSSVASDGERLFVVDASASEIAVLSRDGKRIDSFEIERAASYVSYGSDGMLYVS